MNLNYRLQLATPPDLPALRALIPLSVRALSREHYTEAQIESAIRYVFGPDTRIIADGTYFVAEAEGEIVGCGGASALGSWPRASKPPARPGSDAWS